MSRVSLRIIRTWLDKPQDSVRVAALAAVLLCLVAMSGMRGRVSNADRLRLKIVNLGGGVEFDSKFPRWSEPFVDRRRITKVWMCRRCPTSDDLMAEIATLRSVRELELLGGGVTDTGLKAVASLQGLKVLHLDESQVTDEGLEVAGQFPGLRELSLANTNVGDSGLHHVSALKELRGLRLDGTQVTDEGISRLHGLTNLRVLNCERTRVSAEARRLLREALPQCNVSPNP